MAEYIIVWDSLNSDFAIYRRLDWFYTFYCSKRTGMTDDELFLMCERYNNEQA